MTSDQTVPRGETLQPTTRPESTVTLDLIQAQFILETLRRHPSSSVDHQMAVKVLETVLSEQQR